MNSYFKNSYLKQMVLGSYYAVGGNKGVFKFIKVTHKGYNFYNEERDEVLYFGRHWYEDKKKDFCFRFPKSMLVFEVVNGIKHKN